MAKKYQNGKKNYSIFFALLLLCAVILMGIGYASVNGVFVSINGGAHIIAQNSFHITHVAYESDTGAMVSSSTIIDYTGTTLNSSVTLGNDQTSNITYAVTFYNTTTDSNYSYSGTSYSANFYDNSNITYDVTGINVGDTIYANSSKTIYITFHYAGSNISNPVLNSYISFDFDKYYSITYQNINTAGHNYPTRFLDSETTKTINFTGDVPNDVSITPTVNYTYTVSTINSVLTGVLTLNNIKTNIIINRYYGITYNLNGGTNPNGQPTKYLHGQVINLLNPTKGNDIFDGWYDNALFTGNAITNTNGLTGDLTLYAKWISNSYEIATTYITSLVGDASPNSTNIITLTSIDNTCTNTLAYDNTNEKNLRYVGSNPCNYVNFNCNGTTCELWRIIGVINGIDTNPVIKLVRNDFVSTAAAWDTASKNTWGTASLNTTLNSTYLNSLNNGVVSNYVLNAAWNIGGVTSTSASQAAYNEEKATKSSNAYIGLISPSDYGYATAGTSDSTRSTCLTTGLSNTSATCYNNNFLFGTNHQWTINKRINGNNQVIRITDVGKTTNTKSDGSYYYRPVLYLKSNVKIDTSGGDGRPAHPFDLHVDS